MKTRVLYTSLLLLFTLHVHSQTIYKFWVQLRDKQHNTFSLDNPLEFLSLRAMERRNRQGIPLTEQDLPVSRAYLDSLRLFPIKILYTSRWMNAAVIQASNPVFAANLLDLPCVTGVDYLYGSNFTKKSVVRKWEANFQEDTLASANQLEMLQGHLLHQSGFKGEGMLIAVLDAGFGYADTMTGLDSLFMNGRILGTRSYVEPGPDFFWTGNGVHGTQVLSIMGGNIPGMFMGSAPNASYMLIQTEDTRSEFRIEEANWLAGAELADSAGADVINTSLGYSAGFTNPSQNYTYSDLNGNSTLVTRAAQIAASKGIAVICSAGNYHVIYNPSNYISAPADGASVLAIGAVNPTKIRAPFSSWGPSYDRRIKPDVMAQGEQTSLIDITGYVTAGNGTSFSSPIVAGLTACLWQKYPGISNYELLESIRSSASLNPYPDSLYGYGIPNFSLAGDLITSASGPELPDRDLFVYPNPAGQYLYLRKGTFPEGRYLFHIYDIRGRLFRTGQLRVASGSPAEVSLEGLPPGSYIISLSPEGDIRRDLFIKR